MGTHLEAVPSDSSTLASTSSTPPPDTGTASPTDPDATVWDLIQSLIQLVLTAQRAAQQQGTT